MHNNQIRLLYLDGLRGIAITIVLIWHLFGPADAKFLPYGTTYSNNIVIRNGWMGVELFFLISDFVIFMTIEKCSNFSDFILRRWLRLFPAMAVASFILFSIDRIFSLPGPNANPSLIDLIPGLVFVTPTILNVLTHLGMRSLDEVFWTMYVEMSFYIVFGISYFTIGWQKSILLLIILAIIINSASDIFYIFHITSPIRRVVEPLQWAGFNLFGWFASGTMFYKAKTSDCHKIRKLQFILALVLGVVSTFIYKATGGTTIEIRIGFLFVLATFAGAQAWIRFQSWLSWQPLLFIGFISYPLYLVHNNLGISLTGWIGRNFTKTSAVAVIPAVAIVGLLAVFIAFYLEPFVAQRLRIATDRVRAAINTPQS